MSETKFVRSEGQDNGPANFFLSDHLKWSVLQKNFASPATFDGAASTVRTELLPFFMGMYDDSDGGVFSPANEEHRVLFMKLLEYADKYINETSKVNNDNNVSVLTTPPMTTLVVGSDAIVTRAHAVVDEYYTTPASAESRNGSGYSVAEHYNAYKKMDIDLLAKEEEELVEALRSRTMPLSKHRGDDSSARSVNTADIEKHTKSKQRQSSRSSRRRSKESMGNSKKKKKKKKEKKSRATTVQWLQETIEGAVDSLRGEVLEQISKGGNDDTVAVAVKECFDEFTVAVETYILRPMRVAGQDT